MVFTLPHILENKKGTVHGELVTRNYVHFTPLFLNKKLTALEEFIWQKCY